MYPDVPQIQEFALLGELDVELHCLPENVLDGNILQLISFINKRLSNLKPDLIHYNDPAVVGMLAGRMYGEAGIIMTHHTPELNRNYGWAGKMLERFAFAGHTKVIFTSQEDCCTGMKLDGMAKWDKKVIPYGIDTSLFNDEHHIQDVYDEFGIPHDHQIIVNVARLVPQKGHKYLIDAAKIVLSVYDKVTLLIVGDGDLKDQLLLRADNVGISERCVFAGHRSDVPRILNACDIFVMPSLFEGLCMAVMEAFAAGLPVVATPVGGIPSTVIDCETGVLVPLRNANKLAEALIRVLDNPTQADEMGLMGKKRIDTKFSLDKMVRGTESVYIDALGD
jgi:glycosyltransferase involved in cell wall biosynthesis